jgi:hypothetical protein
MCQPKPNGNLALVPQFAHLTEADIRRYVAGAVSVETDQHVRICPNCALRLADATWRSVHWERRGLLGRLVKIDIPQVIDELLADIAAEQRRDAA